MKKVIIVAMFLMSSILITTKANATTIKNDDNSCLLEDKLENNLKLPESLKKQSNSGVVKVDFKINANHQIEVLNISGNKKEVTAYVKQQLELLGEDICVLEKGIVYHINIKIKIV